MTSNPARRSRLTRLLLGATSVLAVMGLVGAGAFYWVFLRDLPDLRKISDYRPKLASTVLDRQGRPIGEFFNERRRIVPFERIPHVVVMAFVAGEDGTFFEHQGIDFQSILRAAWKNFVAGGKKQGASTITQQMVKGLLLSPEQTYTRKIREMILARRIEQRFTKEEILFLYLNQIYFGHGAYGIGEASHSYFDKGVEDLSISEAALLAGLPKAPSRYSPFRNPDQAEERRIYVLQRMHEDGILDDAAWQAAVADAPVYVDAPLASDYAVAAYFTEEVRRQLFERLGGETVLDGGLVVETTLDLDLQRAAVAAVRKGLEDLDRRQGYRGPLRQVDSDELADETGRLAEVNGIDADAAAAEPEVAAAPAPSDGEETPAAADDAARVRELLPDDRPAVGVVTAVDKKAGLARIAFAPGVEAFVRIEDIAWARKADPDVAPTEVKRIDRVFRVGDVATFSALGSPDEPLPEDSPAHGHLLVGLHQTPIVQGALLSIDVATGEVLALVGGYDFEDSQFNRVTQALRQPGSSFKPLIYGAALGLRDAKGGHPYTPASIVHDRPTVYEDRSSGFVWRPQNYGRRFYGPITLRFALAKSVNNAAVHLADEVGIGKVIKYARNLGVTSPLERSLALALGTSGVTLLELTRAYAVFPNGGRRVVPQFIRRVTDGEGNLLLENVVLGPPEPSEEEPSSLPAEETPAPDAPETTLVAGDAPTRDLDQLIPPEDAYLVADMLRAVVLEGTGWRLKRLGRPLAGKTGTTNDQADAWFMGFSPDIATGVWVGHDVTRFLGWGETGSRAAAPIWVDYMRVALQDRRPVDFREPARQIVRVLIDKKTGLLAARRGDDTVFQAFIRGTEPTERAETRRSNEDALQDLREDAFGSAARRDDMGLDVF